MEITINTDDILGDESTIRDEVIAMMARNLTVSMHEEADKQLQNEIENCVKVAVKEAVSEAVKIGLDTEYTTVGEYGKKGETETLRGRISDIVQALCQFSRKNYDRDKNDFTKIVEYTIAEEVKTFRNGFNRMVTEKVLEETMDHAVSKLRQAMGIKQNEL